MTLRPCLTCGEPSEGSRCPEHTTAHVRGRQRESFRRRGYGAAWDRLSRRARKLQPFCNRCHTTERLTVHHTEQAWTRVEARKPLRLEDVEVLCARCNNAAGSTRPRGDTPSPYRPVPSSLPGSRLHTSVGSVRSRAVTDYGSQHPGDAS